MPLSNLPNCCGSEDGDLVYGVDSGTDRAVMAQAWKCNTCGVISILEIVVLEPTTDLPRYGNTERK